MLQTMVSAIIGVWSGYLAYHAYVNKRGLMWIVLFVMLAILNLKSLM